MSTFEIFSHNADLLQTRIKNHYNKFTTVDGPNIIEDGIVNPEEYFNSHIKILWILKEPYDKENEGDKVEWSIAKMLNEENWAQKAGGVKTTWYPIIYTTYSILKENFKSWDDLDNIEDKPEMATILQKIAVINVQKFPAGTSTNMIDIKNAYEEHKEILLEQVKTYKPDIIIGARTLQYFLHDLNLSSPKYDEFDYWVKDKQLFIEADHPARRMSNEDKEEYIDTIIRISKDFLNGSMNK